MDSKPFDRQGFLYRTVQITIRSLYYDDIQYYKRSELSPDRLHAAQPQKCAPVRGPGMFSPEAEFLDVTWTKVLRVFLHAFHSHLY
jgi:hypothetical protein